MSAAAQTDPYAGVGTPVAPPPTPPGGSDPYAGVGTPVGTVTPPKPPPAAAPDITSNPNNEGTYQMTGPKGDTVMVPYSKVGTIAHDQGYSLVGDGTFHTTGDAARYWKDYGADPHTVQNVKDFYKATQDPGQGAEIGAARGAALTAAGLAHITRKVTGKVTGQDTQQGTTEKALQDFGDDSNTGAEDFGKFVESAGEFLMGDEALKGLSYLDKLKQIMPVLKSVEKSPLLARVLDAAIQQGTVGGAQGLVKSGGDPGTAAEEGATSAGVGGLLGGATGAVEKAVDAMSPTIQTMEGVDVPVPKTAEPTPPTPRQQAGAEAYTAGARSVITPHLQNVVAPEQVGKILDTVHDYTGAAARLADANATAYDAIDDATGGKFRQLNKEVGDAQYAAFDGGPEAQAHYAAKLTEMENLLARSDLKITPEQLQNLKSSWTASYTLKDFGRALDQSLNGHPGESMVSMEQRGINGNVLKSKIDQIVRRYGVDNVRAALGPGRLETLDAIAEATKTNAGRAAVNGAVRHVAGYLGGITGGGLAAAAAPGGVSKLEAGGAGFLAGKAAGHGLYDATQKVFDAIRTDPKVGRQLLYAVEKNLNPSVYGPLIGGMIAAQQTQQQPDGGTQ